MAAAKKKPTPGTNARELERKVPSRDPRSVVRSSGPSSTRKLKTEDSVNGYWYDGKGNVLKVDKNGATRVSKADAPPAPKKPAASTAKKLASKYSYGPKKK